MSTTDLGALAESLRSAQELRSPIAPLTTAHPQMTEEDAYEIQWMNAANALRSGHRVVGYKIGLTSREAQKHFQVFKPDYGHLFEEMAVGCGGATPREKLIQPKIEGEIAFVLGRDLQGPGVTAADVLRSIDFVVGSLEIIDSRIENWKIKAADTIADNGSSALFVLGPQRRSIQGLDLATIGMALSQNGEVMVTASGAAVMGNPVNAVVVLANELGTRNIGLRAGQVILSGSLGGMITVAKGDSYTAEFLSLGRVDVSFT
ncbi:MAG: fumarylacetoacetate hydrolase family protein [Deltaproteobacteria bacterium]|nr:fumarylacetoacetate hydrolase family protein [Deltaproteobacteria bacterium]MBI3294589.1 fumarylacetoacetate hydrolase family protein [Deltaproteobacteria bacterium]